MLFFPFLPELGEMFFFFAVCSGSSNEAVCFAQGCGGKAVPALSVTAGSVPPCLSIRRSREVLAELPELCRALQLLEQLVERTSPQHRALYQGQPPGPAELPR